MTRLRSRITAALVLAAGLVMVFHVPLFSGFELAQTTPGDPRLLTYILERNHQWFSGQRGDESFWDPPFYYPWTGVGTHTDPVISLQPFFTLWRILGAPAGLAYTLCAISLLTACYLSMWQLLRRGFLFETLPASFGAFLYAFSTVRSHQIGHIQLLAHFAMPMAILGLLLEFREGRKDPRQWRWIVLFAAAMVVELYGSAYFFWYSCFLLLIAVGASAVIGPWRRVVLESFRSKALVWIGVALAAVVASLPILVPYLPDGGIEHARDYSRVHRVLPLPQELLFPGEGNLIGQLLHAEEWSIFSPVTANRIRPMGIGFITSLLILGGLWWRRRDPATVVLTVVGALALLFVLRWPGGFSFWRLAYEYLPGAAGLRAIYRIVLPLLVVSAIGAAASIEHLRRRSGGVIAAALMLVAMSEQLQSQKSFDWRSRDHRARAIASAIPPQCDAFFFSSLSGVPDFGAVIHIDAMWAGLYAGVPTVNGRSGYPPRGWYDMVKGALLTNPTPRAEKKLIKGLAAAGVTDETVCWIRLDLSRGQVANSRITELPIEAYRRSRGEMGAAGRNEKQASPEPG